MKKLTKKMFLWLEVSFEQNNDNIEGEFSIDFFSLCQIRTSDYMFVSIDENIIVMVIKWGVIHIK